GASSLGISFVDYLGKRNQCITIKEAVSGTTLVDNGNNSYVSRLKKVNKDQKIDLFICQLSTNDATKNYPLGTLDSDTSTVLGSISYIVDYVKTNFDCPIMFYTNSYYESEPYFNMVKSLNEGKNTLGIGVIDMYSDQSFNKISNEERKLYMEDNIHPTKAGYLKWWTPYIEKEINKYLGDK
ncbi:MAG: SGNH/GDSL hydrolase family protein, partial [Bacilli bacterium]|nr:SGNH/GDSL hydrolase family protein [Bacilli bacterium]